MKDYCKEKYGVNFADDADSASYKHSYRDYELLPKTEMVVQPPSLREIYVEIPGADGELDLSEVLIGRPLYDGREAKFEFLLINRERWRWVYSRLMGDVHGKRMRIVLDDDSNYYYAGRVKVNSFESSPNLATIVVNAHLDPYKKSLIANSERWLWDPFNFETDVARDYSELVVNGSLKVTVIGSRMPVAPVLKVSSDMTVLYNGVSYQLTTGSNRIVGMVLVDEEYEMTFTGNGTVTIQFEVGSL